MKKILIQLTFLTALLLLLSGCASGQSAVKSAEPSASVLEEQSVEPSYSSFTLNIKYVGETEESLKADLIVFALDDGTEIRANATDGSASIENFPAAEGISCYIRRDSELIAEHELSFWTGYDTAFYNNLQSINIDMPGNIEAMYITVQVTESGDVKCIAASEKSFDDKQTPADDFSGAVNASAAAEAGIYGTRAVTETGVNLRESSSTDSKTLRQMNFADQVTLMDQGEQKDGKLWYKVKYEQLEGYISAEYLGKLYTVNNNGVNIREQPNAGSASLYMVSSGTHVVGTDDGTKTGGEIWYKVITRGGITGYIRSDFLERS